MQENIKILEDIHTKKLLTTKIAPKVTSKESFKHSKGDLLCAIRISIN